MNPLLQKDTYAYVVNKKDYKGRYALNVNDIIYVFETTELNKLCEYKTDIELEKFYDEYNVISETINEFIEIFVMLEKSIDKPIISTENQTDENDDLTDTLEFQKAVENRRYQSFVEKCNKREVPDFPVYKKSGYYGQGYIYAWIVPERYSFIEEQKGRTVLRLHGKSLQIISDEGNLGRELGVLLGNDMSYVELGTLDSIIFLQKRKIEWKMLEYFNHKDAKEHYNHLFDLMKTISSDYFDSLYVDDKK